MTEAVITGLFTYPVKGLRGIALDRAELHNLGLPHDRRWMVVRANGKFVTQRDNGRLALIETTLEAGGVRLSRPGHGDILVPFATDDGAAVDTAVWGAELRGAELGNGLGDAIGAWLTAAVESTQPLRLVKMHPKFVQADRHPDVLGAGARTLFADAAPFTLANEASLAALNDELSTRGHDVVPMNRFRPNLVVKGIAAFAERDAVRLEGPGYRMRLPAPVERCVVTTIDQGTGERHPDRQPWRTLRDINPMPGNPKAPAFAQYALLADGAGRTLRVGDRVSVNGA